MISLLTGLAIGLVFGVPVGAAGIMSMQRTLSAGPVAGFITGMGSSVAACLYSALGFLGPSLLSQTFLSYQKPIVFAGAILLRQSGSSGFATSLGQKGLLNELIAGKAMLAL